MRRTVLGVFINTSDAEGAINRLEAEGFNPKDISIVTKGTKSAEIHDHTGADVASGAATGVATGGLLGALAGLLVSTGVIPGVGAILIGGPIATALGLTGAAATALSGAVMGAVTGGLVGVLTGLGLSENDAKMYEDRIKEGGILVAVPTTDVAEIEVMDILEDYGANQVKTIESADSSRESRRRGSFKEDPAAYYRR